MSAKATHGFRRFMAEIRELVRTARKSWRLLSRSHRYSLLGAVAVMGLGASTSIFLPLLSGRLVDDVSSGLQKGETREAIYQDVAFVLLLIAGLVLARELLQVFRRYLVENTCTRIERHMTIKVVSHLMQTDISELTHERIGALHGKIFRSIAGYMRLLRLSFLEFFPAMLLGIFAIAVAVWKQPLLGVVMLGVLPTSLSITVWQLISQKRVRLKLLRVNEEMDGTVVELLGGIDYVRVANAHSYELKRVARAAEHKRHKELKHHIAMSLFGAWKATIEGLFHVGVLALAAYLAISGQISFGDILTFSMLYLSAVAPLNEIHRVVDEGHECSLRVRDLQELLAMPIDQSFHTPTVQASMFDNEHPVICSQGVQMDYRFADGRTRRALHDINLEVHPGEIIGVAGKSGCGKSTWIKVLMRLLHPCNGSISIKGVPLSKLSRENIAQLVGYVGQNPFIFSGTIEENIVYGIGNYQTDDLPRVAKMACIHDEIMAMPDGYKSKVEERGANLSGGQKQRLALARVFLKDPPILILDEATSALDTISERQVREAIAMVSRQRTIIMVAHRLSSFADVDRILVFNDGQLIETGTYDNLITRDGLFAELVRAADMNPHASPVKQQVAG
jgi:ATP-binding cassette subfamily B protein